MEQGKDRIKDSERAEALTSFGLTYKLIREIKIYQRQHILHTGREPTKDEIKGHLSKMILRGEADRTLEIVADMALRGEYEALPIDLNSYDVAGPDMTAETALNKMARDEADQRLKEALDGLTEKQRRIISAHYGLGGEPKTFQEIAAELGISIAAVAIMQRRAMRNLRNHYGLKFEDLF